MQTLILKTMPMANAMNLHLSHSQLLEWEYLSRQRQQYLILVVALGMRIPPGRLNVTSRYPRRKSRTSSLISPKSLASRKIL